MMLTKDLIPIRESTPFFPGRPSPQTIWRWTVKGVRGVVLKSLVVGGVRYVHPDWIDEFIRQQNSSASLLTGGKSA